MSILFINTTCMKYAFSLIFLLFSFQYLHAQDVSGTWKGEFNTNSLKSGGNYKIIIVIKLNADSSYEVLTYTPDLIFHTSGTFMACKTVFKKLSKNYFRLEEIDEKKTKKERLQTMYLKYKVKKGKEFLSGNWFSDSGKNRQIGFVDFVKADDIKIENLP